MNLELYLHFPFCVQKCLYCDFCSAPGSPEQMKAYCDALCKEIRLMGEKFPDAHISTVFFGGGTPSLIPPESMSRVIRTLRDSFFWLPNAEFTSECNPGTLTDEWLETMCRGGMNRLSVGMQAAQLPLLQSLGRIHTHEQTVQAVRMAEKHGIDNLNLDLMMALPGQTREDWLETLESACILSPEHISAYSLILEEGTPLFRLVQSGQLALPDEDFAADLYEEGLAFLRRQGYQRYEISNFAKEGYTCKHNLGYWQDQWYLGLGVAAHSMLPPNEMQRTRGIVRVRPFNLTDTSAYIRAMGENPESRIAGIEEIMPQEAVKESLMLRLRTSFGLSYSDFEAVHGISFPEAWKSIARTLASEGLVLLSPDGFSLSDRGTEVQNAVLLRFFS